MKYKAFPKFIYRIPCLALNYNDDKSFRSALLQEAIYLASPDLYLSLLKDDATVVNDLPERLRFSFTKYLSRMKSRCTPFGLFAGLGVGEVGQRSAICLPSKQAFRSVTRLDMNFLCALIQKIEDIPEIRKHLRYFLNSSAYVIKDRFRYIEFKYKGSNRNHFLSEIENDEILNEIINRAKSGLKLSDSIALIMESGFDEDEAVTYTENLVDNHILVSELDPGVTGDDVLKTLIRKLEETIPQFVLIDKLKNIYKKLDQIDSLPIGRSISLYSELEDEIKELGVGYERKYLFQTDLVVTPNGPAVLGQDLVDQTTEAISVLNRLSPPYQSSLTEFKENFYNRYEEEEVPLCEVLDSDIGVSFLDSSPGSGEIHPLIDDMRGSAPARSNNGVTATQTEIFLYNKFMKAIGEEVIEVEITEEEIVSFRENWEDLPTTFSCLIEVFKVSQGNGNLIAIGPIGGASAACLIARFCHLDNSIKQHVLNITDFEKQALTEDKILCEIVHLPESRIGNVLHRPALRDFEISYLSNNGVEKVRNIEISDIMISLKRRNQIVLRSKKLDKEIIPRLSTAHNFNNNSLPIYQFLCRLQTDGIRGGLSFKWGSIVGNRGFYPRLKYKNVILSVAQWNLDSKILTDLSNSPDKLSEIEKIRKRLSIPRLINVVRGDNKIVVDLEDIDLINMFILEAKKANVTSIEEFLFDEDSALVKGDSASHVNQVILSYFKEQV